MPRWFVVALAAALGCVPLGAKRRVSNPESGQHLYVPYPVSDPIKLQSGPRLALAAAGYMLVDPDPAPYLVARVLLPDEGGFDALYAAAFGKVYHEQHDRRAVTRKVIATAGIEDPGDSVILVSNEGPCRADVGEPAVELRAAPRRLEIGWRLSGCTAQSFAPVAVLAARVPDALRWRPAELVVDRALLPEKTLKDPHAPIALAPAWDLPDPPTTRAFQVWSIPDVVPTIVQIYDGLWRQPDDVVDPCAGLESWMQTNGWLELYPAWSNPSHAFDPIEPGDDPNVAPQLRGAIVHEQQVDAIVYDQRDAPLVIVPPATGEDGITIGWTITLVDPGLVAPDGHDWGWSALDRTATWRPVCP